MKKLATVLLLLALAVPVSAQMSDRADLDAVVRANNLGLTAVSKPSSLIDLSKLHWSNSYSLSYISGGGYSGSVGVLNTSMLYEFSPKLSLMLNVGIAHNAGAIWGNGNSDASILPGFVLDYHPSEKFRMSIGMQTIRTNGVYPYGSNLFSRGYDYYPYTVGGD